MAADKADRKAQARTRWIRATVLAVMLAATTAGGLLHQYAGVKPVGVDALCPFGGLESLWAVITAGTLVQRIAWSSLVLLAATVIVAVVFRRAFCGKLCPLGALQEFFGFIRRKVGVKRFTVPGAVDRPLRYLKYLVLAVFVIWTAVTGVLVMRPFDPWVAWQHLTSEELLAEFAGGLIVLGFALAGSFLWDRAFCKYLCPMGAFLGIIGRIGPFRIRRNESTCIGCTACDRVCPANILVSKLDTVGSAECIDCDLCVASCPVKDTLVIEGPGHRRVTPTARLGITLGIIVLVVGVTSFTGQFEWTVRPLAERAHGEGAAIPQAAPAAPGQEATAPAPNGFDAAAIKGSDSFRDVAEATGIPEGAFEERFGLSAQAFGRPIKESAHAAGSTFDVEAVRQFVRERLGN